MKKIFSILFQCGLVSLPLILPVFSLNFESSNILTAVSLLFAILIGFFVGASTSNYLKLQSLISNEDARLISVFQMVKVVQPKAAKKIANCIDDYMISSLDYEFLNYVRPVTKEFNALIKTIDSIRPTDPSVGMLLQNIHSAKTDLMAIRQETALSVKAIVSRRHWLILIMLALVIAFILMSLRTGGVVPSLLIGLILVVMYQTLYLLHAIDTNDFLAQKIAYENPQYVFQSIGKQQYYPEHALMIYPQLKKSLNKENYRMGCYTNYSESFSKKIILVKNK